VITNVGTAHIGKLGSRDAVRSAKLEILQGLNVVVINADDNYLIKGVEEAENFKGQIITFGVKNDSHVMAKDIRTTDKGSSFLLDLRDKESIRINLSVHALFNIYNALAAATVCLSLGRIIEEIKAALEAYRTFTMRFEVIKTNGITLINDSYNANPSSMEESLREALRLGGKGRITAVLGDMSELDEFSELEHKTIGRMVSEMGIDVFIGVGKMMSLAAEECMKTRGQKPVPEIIAFTNTNEANREIMNILKQQDTVLIKGSRKMSMEKIVRRIIDAV
jgi:UDP-N-acetylmuramoyl-tripeptide--D-alanyl-D-alanine ligase